MTYEIYEYIFIGGAILTGVMLAVSALVFFLLKIPNVIGDLTGANARKAIENIRNQNESSGDKTYRTSQVNLERGKITDKISPSGRLIKNPSGSVHGAMETEKIGDQQSPMGGNETTVLGGNETTVLGGAETTVLGGGETTVLGGAAEMGATGELTGGGETTVLGASAAPAASVTDVQTAIGQFVVEYEITYTHTDEIIA